MPTSTFIEKIRVNNPMVMEKYVEAMESAANTPVKQRKKMKAITDPQELREIMHKGIEMWGRND